MPSSELRSRAAVLIAAAAVTFIQNYVEHLDGALEIPRSIVTLLFT
jgi:hypothetical protein